MQYTKLLLLLVLIASAVVFGYRLNNQQSSLNPNGTKRFDTFDNKSIQFRTEHSPKKIPPSNKSDTGYRHTGRNINLDKDNSSLNKKTSATQENHKEKSKNKTVGERLEQCENMDNSRKKKLCYRKILNKDPEFAPAHYLLGAIYMNNAQFNLANKQFALFWKHATKGQKEKYNIYVYTDLNAIKKTLRQMEPKKAQYEKAVKIPYKTMNGQILVKVLLNGNHKANMIFDTGASISVLSPAITKKLGLENKGTITLRTIAQGELKAKLYNMHSLELGTLMQRGLTVAAAKIPALQSSYIDGILGMDFLSDYSFKINHSKQEIVFK